LIVPVTGQLVCVMAVPGDTPTFPVTVPLVQVTAVPARTAKLPAAPTEGAAATSEVADDAPLIRAASLEVREAAEEGVHARRDAASGMR
jgi:hypothetical protein